MFDRERRMLNAQGLVKRDSGHSIYVSSFFGCLGNRFEKLWCFLSVIHSVDYGSLPMDSFNPKLVIIIFAVGIWY